MDRPLRLALMILAVASIATGAETLARATGLPESRSFVAGERADFSVRWKLVRPLPAGSQIRVLTPREGGWSRPSLDPQKEESPGQYGRVEYALDSGTGAKLRGEAKKYSDRGPPYTKMDRISQFVMTVEGAGLEAGDGGEIKFPQARVSRIALHPDPRLNVTGYRLQIRRPGEEQWREIEGLPRYGIVPDKPHRVQLKGPSQAVVGEKLHFAVAVLDRYRNPAPEYVGRLTVTCSDPAAEYPRTIEVGAAQKGIAVLEPVVLKTPGYQTVTIHAGVALPGGETAVVGLDVRPEAPPLRLYWGELHSHGMLSYDARNWGGCTMRPDDMFWWARAVSGLDFAAVTDHSMHNGRLTQQNMTEEDFQEIQKAAAEHNAPGRFITFTAVEQRCARGDTNVFFLTDNQPYYMKEKPISIQALWEFCRRADIVTIPHLHPMVKRKDRFDLIDPDKERLIEIHSNHGRYEFHDNRPLWPRKGMVEGNNVQAILARGHRLGIVAASDDHSGRPGSTDVTGIYATDLSREAIFKALRARHTYGTTGPRMNILFQMGEKMMGDDVLVPRNSPLRDARRFTASVIASRPITRIEVVRNGQVVYSTEPNTRMAAFEYADTSPLAGAWLGTEKNNPPTAYYYLRVTQEPTDPAGKGRVQMAWTSPIFLSSEGGRPGA